MLVVSKARVWAPPLITCNWGDAVTIDLNTAVVSEKKSDRIRGRPTVQRGGSHSFNFAQSDYVYIAYLS